MVTKILSFEANLDVTTTTITKLKPQVVFQYGFRSFLQHRK